MSRLGQALRARARPVPSAALDQPSGTSSVEPRVRRPGRTEGSVPRLVQLGLASLLGNGLVGMTARELASLESPRRAGVRCEVPERAAFVPSCTPLDAPPGTGTLARIPGVGAWRGEAVAQALWLREAPAPSARRRLAQGGEASLAGLERVSGIGAVTAARLAAAQGHLRHVVHWRPETWP